MVCLEVSSLISKHLGAFLDVLLISILTTAVRKHILCSGKGARSRRCRDPIVRCGWGGVWAVRAVQAEEAALGGAREQNLCCPDLCLGSGASPGPGWSPATSWVVQTPSEASSGSGLPAPPFAAYRLLPKLSPGGPHPETSHHRPLLSRWFFHCAMTGQELGRQESDAPPQHQLPLGWSVPNSMEEALC